MIVTTEHGRVRELRLDRPPANALSPELIAALERAIVAAPEEGAGAIVLSGAPGRFSGGLDVPLLLTLDRETIAAVWRDLYRLMRALAASPIPVAAAITGHAPAGGTVLPLFCDWRGMAAGDWKLGLNEVKVGLPLPPVILAALRRQVGPRQAERLAVEGILISPEEALGVGLVDEIVPAERLVERAIEWCESQLASAPQAMSVTRRRARADLVALFDEAASSAEVTELAEVTESWWSPEAQSVLRALIEKMAQKKK